MLSVTSVVRFESPSKSSVSFSRSTASLPLSPVIESSVETEVVVADVIRPLLSTVKIGSEPVAPYVPALTPVVVRPTCTAPPSPLPAIVISLRPESATDST